VTERGSEEATTPTSGQVVGKPADDPEVVAPHPRRGTVRFAWGATVVILIGVVVLLVYAFSTPSNPTEVVRRSPTSPAILTEVGQISGSVFDNVGVTAPTTPLTAPSVVNGPALVEAGKPEVLYVGAEFCSFCAAERWALVVALSRFGRFTALANMQSAPQSAFPSIQSFSFVGSTYASRYLTFTGTELYSNAVDSQGAFTRIATLTSEQAALLDRYGNGAGGPTSYPFVDINNLLVAGSAGFSPGVLTGLSQGTIAGNLDQPGTASTQAIIASANYLTAGMCRATHGLPAPVCTSRGVSAAAQALGIPISTARS
jgi:hypothetical protein